MSGSANPSVIPKAFTSVREWLDYFENRPQQEIQLGLERIKTVADRLQVLEMDAVIISVAGTNGKGSTVATLEAIYSESGYRVGAYTSPHLLVFNERIRLNCENISDPKLCELFGVIEHVRESIHLTYFEMATLAALLYFKQLKPDVIILEVGLGGRLDATNIVDADLAIITTIDFDHQELLGDTLEAIGYEKAGILRPEQFFIYADSLIPQSIVQRAQELNVTSLILNEHYWFEAIESVFNVTVPSRHCLLPSPAGGRRVGDEGGFMIHPALTPGPSPTSGRGERDVLLPSPAGGRGELDVTPSMDTLQLPLPAVHWNAAAAAVVATQCFMDRLPVSRAILSRALQNVRISGRQQFIYDTICTVLDVSHNPQSVKLLSERMKSWLPPDFNGKVHAVFSGLKDKDLCGLIDPMHPYVDHWYTAPLDSKRAASETWLREIFRCVDGIVPHMYGSIVEAYQAAKQSAISGDVIVVYGSFLVVSPILLVEGWVCSGSVMSV